MRSYTLRSRGMAGRSGDLPNSDAVSTAKRPLPDARSLTSPHQTRREGVTLSHAKYLGTPRFILLLGTNLPAFKHHHGRFAGPLAKIRLRPAAKMGVSLPFHGTLTRNTNTN